MTGNRRTFIVAGLCCLLTASSALAGGGGKRDTKLRIRNEGSTQVGVAVGLTQQELINISNANDPVQAWLYAGGKILNPGQTATFKVNEGSTQIYTAFDPADGLADQAEVDLDKGENRLVIINEGGQIDVND